MCGIAGILGGTSGVDVVALRAMTGALTRRGPDGEGFHVEDAIGLGHRRLSIIDLEGGAQPLYSNDKTCACVVNGEIYNFRALRRELEQAGHAFATGSDSEVVVHGYAAWGEDVLARLEGQFAIAIWDARQERLLLARDPMGEKPLFWGALPGGGLAFASELRALLLHPDIDHGVDPVSLARYLVHEYVPAPMSMIRGARKLEAGHWLSMRPGHAPMVHPYWELPLWATPPGGRLVDLGATAIELRRALRRSVEARLVADVPVGVFLSGGLDSSLVTALAMQARGGDVDTFSIGFRDPSYDESSHARQVARALGTRHHERIVEPHELLALIPTLGELLDEPFGDGSLVPTYLLAQFAREHVTVALGGDGSDELFAGYPTFQAEAWAGGVIDALPVSVARAARSVGSALASRLPVSTDNFSVDFKVKQLLRGVDAGRDYRHQAWLASLLPDEVRAVLCAEVAARARTDDLYDVVRRKLSRCPSGEQRDRLLWFYATGYLADDILVKTDRASMEVSLEVRSPFLAPEVIDIACRAAPSLRSNRRELKRLVKRAARGLVPDAIIDRPKHGFGMPIAGWLRGELREFLCDSLSPARVARDGFFNPAAVTKLVEEHTSGVANHRKPLWTLLAFQSWHERISRAPRASA